MKKQEVLKLKFLYKVSELDQYQLQMYLDVPYLESNHKKIRDEVVRKDEEIKELDEKLDEKLDEAVKPFKTNNPIFKTANPNRILIGLIIKDKEI